MTGDVVAKRYADALMSLAVEENVHKEIRDQIEKFSEFFEESGLKRALVDPSLDIVEKTSILKDVSLRLKLNSFFENFLKILVQNKRITALRLINDSYQQLYDMHAGRIRAEIILPYGADEKEIENMKKGLESSTKKEVVLNVKVDEALIGGIVARVGSTSYDGSVRAQLDNIKNSMMRG